LSRKRGKSTENYVIYFSDDAGKYSPEIYTTHFPDIARKSLPKFTPQILPLQAMSDSVKKENKGNLKNDGKD